MLFLFVLLQYVIDGTGQTFLPSAFVFCICLQSDVVLACDVAEHLLTLAFFCCFACSLLCPAAASHASKCVLSI